MANEGNEVNPRCPGYNRFTVALLFGYMFLGHIVLLNMLIAMMSSTYNKVSDKNTADHHRWFLSRYKITYEYLNRSVFVPPLNFGEFELEVNLKNSFSSCFNSLL